MLMHGVAPSAAHILPEPFFQLRIPHKFHSGARLQPLLQLRQLRRARLRVVCRHPVSSTIRIVSQICEVEIEEKTEHMQRQIDQNIG